MPFVFTQSQIDILTAHRDAGDFASMYAEVYAITANPDVNGNIAHQMVREWFRAAGEANSGIGAASDLIRDYTAAQILLRTGQAIDPAHMQNASDALADRLFSEYLQFGDLPTLETIAATDMDAIIDSLNSNGYNVDAMAWSGNLLFVGLGNAAPLSTNLLADTSDSYDIFAAAKSLQSAGLWTAATATWDALWTTLSFPVSTAANAAELIGDFLDEAYGAYVPSSIQLFLGSIVIDLQGDVDGLLDPGTGATDNFVHGGEGNDVLIGTYGNDLVDGGAGLDSISFERDSVTPDFVSLNLELSPAGPNDVPQSGEIVWGDGSLGQTVIFDVEEIALGVNDDVLHVAGPNHVQEVNGLGHHEFGDTIITTLSSHAIVANLAGGAIDIDGDVLSVTDFENVIGTSIADQITGDSEANILVGGAGEDVIIGGGGNDILLIDAADTSVKGGAGVDTAYFVGEAGVYLEMLPSEIEIAIGGAGNDTISSSGPDMIAGGGGDDLLGVEANLASPAVVWGGEGQDVIDIYSDESGPVGIMTVSVDGLNSENFSQFSLDMLGLGSDFNWSEIDVVILNPDTQDRITINGEIQGTGEVTEDVSGEVMTSMGFEWVNPWTSYSYTGTLMTNYIGDTVGSSYYVDEYQAGFLSGSGLITVQAGAAEIGTWSITEAKDSDDNVYVAPENYQLGEIVDFGSSDFSSGWVQTGDHQGKLHVWVTFGGYQNGEMVYGWPDEYEEHGIAWGTLDWNQLSTFQNHDDMLGPWFVFGGAFDGMNLSASGALSVSMPTDENAFSLSDWLADVGATNLSFDPGATEQSGTSGSNNFSFNSSNAGTGTTNSTTIVFSFNETEDTVEIDDNIVNPNQAGAGITLAQVGENVEITYGSGAGIVLDGVSLSDWQGATALTPITGTSGTDVLTGTSGDDVMDGLGGNDQLYGGEGNDSISDTSGNNSFHGEAGDDVLSGLGGNGHDKFYGGTGNDVMTGGGGRDIFYFANGDGADEITDFSISDTIYIDGVMIGDPDNLPTGVTGTDGTNGYELHYGSGDMITLTGVSAAQFHDWARLNVTGTAGDDVIAGRSSADVLSGADGDDTITGGGGRDTLSGDAGNDVLDGGGDHDTMHGGDGDDLLSDANGNNTYFGDAGNDTITGGGGHEQITGGTGDDSLTGGGGNDTFHFTTGDETDAITDFDSVRDSIVIDGVTISDLSNLPTGVTGAQFGVHYVLSYGSGDQIVVQSSDALVAAYPSLFGDPDQLLSGDEGADTLTGGNGNDSLLGYAGDDLLSGGTDDDELTGGDGSDTFSFDKGDGADIILDFEPGIDELIVDGTTITDLTALPGGVTGAVVGPAYQLSYGNGDTILIASTAELIAAYPNLFTSPDQNLTGTSGMDTLVGGLGNDVIDGLGNSDRLYGGEGNDSISDTSGNNSFYGEAGDDVLSGLGGNGHDKFYGGTGNDVMTGGGGRDIFYFANGDGTDEITDFSISDTIYIDGVMIGDPDNLPNGVTGTDGTNGYELHYGSGDMITLTGVSAAQFHDWARLNVTGTAGDDVIAGRSSADVLSGADGDDTITGGGGRDTLSGDAGNDVLDGGGDHDTMHGGDGDDLLSDASGNNTYFGDAGNDTITGGGGHEQITGGTGDDSLTGGGGNDTFHFTTGDGMDAITDFNTSGDLICFNATGLSYADLTITDTAGGALTTYGTSDSILLEGLLAADLGMDDFLFTVSGF